MIIEPGSTQTAAQFSVALLGARMHYAVPRILAAAGMLDRLFTDLPVPAAWAGALRPLSARRAPAWARRFASRVPQGLELSRIIAFPAFGWEYLLRKRMARSAARQTATYLWGGREFCRLILRKGLGNASAVYTYNSAGLEVMRFARAHGIVTVMEQTIAPLATEWQILAEEHERFPGWEAPEVPGPQASALCERERAEWHEADLIVCASDFVRAGVRDCGGPFANCAVVPYGGDFAVSPVTRTGPRRGGPLRVLFAGAVGLRKGAPYVLETARLLKGLAQCRMVGPVQISPEAGKGLTEFVELTGPVPRSDMAAQYAWADVFLLPSMCEGSATVCYEALAAGLPVVTTPNAGSVVRDGMDGFIVPIRDPEAIAGRLELLRARPQLLSEMSKSALERSREFTLSRYGERLIAALTAASLSKSEAATPARAGE